MESITKRIGTCASSNVGMASSQLTNPTSPYEFTVGICASDEASSLPTLLQSILSESFPRDFSLCRIVIVESACPREIMDHMRTISENDDRLLVLEETERLGKADALNKIFERCVGDFLLLINGDALPSKGSIAKLLNSIAGSKSIGVVSAEPYFEAKREGGGVLAKIEQFMWSVHNESSLLLNHMNISNHSSDEMMITRTNLLMALPYGLVNDGAYIAATMKNAGYSIRFCKDAKVKIDVPSRISDSVGQRRRILFGHFQVLKWVGKLPITVESMLLISPLLGLRILVRTLARSPKFIAILPLAIPIEVLASFMAMIDLTRSSTKHRIWKRYGR